jgi:hypothetical protein
MKNKTINYGILILIGLAFVTTSVYACPFDQGGHYVIMQFVDRNDTPLHGFVLSHHQMEDTWESRWLMAMLGFNQTEYYHLNDYAGYNIQQTDQEGYVVETMFSTVKYSVNLYNATANVSKTYMIYPSMDSYKFVV